MVTPQTIRLRGTRSVARAARAMGVIRNPLVLRVMDWLEFVAYHSANSCVALSSGIAQGIARRGVPESRVVTAPNGCGLDLFAADVAEPVTEIYGLPPEAFVATFTGAHGVANGLGAVLDGAANFARAGGPISFLCLLVTGRKNLLLSSGHTRKAE